MIKTEELSDAQWQAAHQIAIKLAKGTDVNEFRKAIAYLKTISDRENAGQSFFSYLNTLARNGDKIGHSKRARGYYQDILEVCDNHLVDFQTDAAVMLQVLGWGARLIKYYKKNPVGEDFIPSTAITEPLVSKRQEEIAREIATSNFAEGQIVDAVITGKSTTGSKVTYTIANTTIRLTNREPKLFKSLLDGQQVKVKIVKLDDGKVKKIKLSS
ncbi:MAG: hypothetical protein AAF378_12335 [Cyanobacteria bacterium P01_A01_bin.84]